MAWQSLREDLEEEFSSLQRYEHTPREPAKTLRRSPPPDPRRAALERQADALLGVLTRELRLERNRKRVRAWCRENQERRNEQQRARREAAKDGPPLPGCLEGPLTRKRRKEALWRAGPGRERDLEAKRRWAAKNREKRAAYERERRKKKLLASR
jgi:hypothetical protein